MSTTAVLSLGLAALLPVGLACGSDEPKELGVADFACSSDEDCVLRSVPYCCVGNVDVVDTCVNRRAEIPSEVECPPSSPCPAVLRQTDCACVANESFGGPDAPERVCSGRAQAPPDGG